MTERVPGRPAKANEALPRCLDALAAGPELDEFNGQVMAAVTRRLGAVFPNLRVRRRFLIQGLLGTVLFNMMLGRFLPYA